MKKSIKISALSLIIVLSTGIIGGCGWSSSKDIHSLEYFIDNESYHSGLTSYLLPTEDFWQKYPYFDGDFYYQFEDDGPFKNERTRTLLYFIYDNEIYVEAKEAMLNTVPISEFHQYTYNNYVFMENLTLALYNAELDVKILGESAWDNHFSKDGESLRFPFRSTMVCYCDDKDILMFLGLDLNSTSHINKAKILRENGDIEAFLKEFFPFYDFDA